MSDTVESLAKWLAWLEISDCPCKYAWKHVGTLYGISMGHGWVRTSTEPNCPHHTERP